MAVEAEYIKHCGDCVFQKQGGCLAHSLDPWDYTIKDGIIQFDDKYCQFKRTKKWEKKDEPISSKITRVNNEVKIRWAAIFEKFDRTQVDLVLAQSHPAKKVAIFCDHTELDKDLVQEYPNIEWVLVLPEIDKMEYACKHHSAHFMVKIEDISSLPTNFFSWLNDQVNYKGFTFMEISSPGVMEMVSLPVRNHMYKFNPDFLEKEAFTEMRWKVEDLPVGKDWDRRNKVWI